MALTSAAGYDGERTVSTGSFNGCSAPIMVIRRQCGRALNRTFVERLAVQLRTRARATLALTGPLAQFPRAAARHCQVPGRSPCRMRLALYGPERLLVATMAGNHERSQVKGEHSDLSTAFAWLLVSTLHFRKADCRGMPQQGRRREDCVDQPARGGLVTPKIVFSRPLGRPETVAYPVDPTGALLLNPCKRQPA